MGVGSGPEASRRVLILYALGLALIGCCLLIYLPNFPLSFFCDEGLHLSEARSLLESGRDVHGVSWPLFFKATGAYEFGLSVYLQLPFSFVLGPTEESVRVKTAVVCLILSGVLGLVLRRVQGFSAWWATPLVIFCSSLFFILSRTGYQAPIAILLYGIAMAAFMAWREAPSGSAARFIYTASIAAVLSAYTYTAARGWVAMSGLGILLIDRQRLWSRRAELAGPIGVFACAAIPFLGFLWNAPDDFFARLSQLEGEAVRRDPERWSRIAGNVLAAFSPNFWFGESLQLSFGGGERYRLAGLPYIPRLFSLFAVVGVIGLVRERARTLGAYLMLIVISGLTPAVFLQIKPLRCFPVWLTLVFLVLLGLGQIVYAQPRRDGALWRAWPTVIVSVLVATLVYQAYWADFRASGAVGSYGTGGLQFGAREVGGWLQDHRGEFRKVYVLPKVFTAPVETIEAFFPDARKRVQLLNPERLCSPDFEELFAPFGELVLLTRAPLAELPQCGLTYSVRESIYAPDGAITLSVVTAAEALSPNP